MIEDILEPTLEDYQQELRRIRGDLSLFRRYQKQMQAVIDAIPYKDMDEFQMQFKLFLKGLDYLNIRLYKTSRDRIIIARNSEGQYEVFFFMDKKEKLDDREIKKILNLSKKYENAVALICFAGYRSDVSDALYNQRDAHGFELLNYDDLKEETNELNGVYQDIMMVQMDLLDKLKQTINILKKERMEKIQPRVIN